MLQLPTPHHGKLIACLNNTSLPAADKDRVKLESVGVCLQVFVKDTKRQSQGDNIVGNMLILLMLQNTILMFFRG
jgi:hypothetical protein